MKILILLAPMVAMTASLFFGDSDEDEWKIPDLSVVVQKPQDGSKRYRFTRNQENNPSGYTPVNGENAAGDEVSFIAGYSRRYEKEGRGRRSHGGFETRMVVCQGEYSSQSYWFLTESRCPSDSYEEFSFYVADSERGDSRQFTYGVCETRGYLYSRIVTGRNPCHSGDDTRHSASFYAFGGDRMCSPVEKPNHGYVVDTRKEFNVRVTSARFGCYAGYHLDGSSSVHCLSSGHWSGHLPRCAAVKCSRPRDPAHGHVEGDDFRYGDEATFVCDTGYQPYPQNKITCRDDGQWPSIDIACERISCNYPGDIPNGDVNGEGYKFGDQVRFSCADRYYLEGAERAFCQGDGSWSAPLPKCKKVKCPALPQNSNLVYRSTDFSAGSTVIFQCHSGYTLIGATAITCNQEGKDGVWSEPIPTCQQIRCEPVTAPEHGRLFGSDFTYGASVTYTCDTGYILEGSNRATCQTHGWDSPTPTCRVVECRDPGTPEHGQRTGESSTFGTVLEYSCDEGYILKGTKTLTCGEDGRWNSKAPTCRAVDCGPLSTPDQGSREGDETTFGSLVTFTCFPGYEIFGSNQTECQKDGAWTNRPPTCKACPIGFYKPGSNTNKCEQCPERSSTTSEASFSRDHCTCEQGSTKTEDGSCKAVSCEVLSAPEHGSIPEECGTEENDECYFSCDPGYILKGTRIRRCTSSGWSGIMPVCTACPENSYKEQEGSLSCTPCPLNTHTDGGMGVSLDSCVCIPGFTRQEDGTCADIDECETEKGGCSQACENSPGSFKCYCTIPGYELQEDGKTCHKVRGCEELNQSLEHGSLSCSYTESENGYLCFIRCEQSYFFVSGINNYLTCGPDTEFEWSHRRVNHTARIPACTKEFFVDVLLPVSLSFASSLPVNDLRVSLAQMKEHMEQVVKDMSSCGSNCDVTGLTLSVEANPQGGSTVKVEFSVQVKNPNPNALHPDCDPTCQRMNMREMLATTFAVKNELENLVKQAADSLDLDLGTNSLEANTDSFTYSKPQMICDEGKVYTKNRLCVPCDRGYYLENRGNSSCSACPVGTFQDQLGQTTCKPCYPGTTTVTNGSDHAVMCSVKVTDYSINTTEPPVFEESQEELEEEAKELVDQLMGDGNLPDLV